MHHSTAENQCVIRGNDPPPPLVPAGTGSARGHCWSKHEAPLPLYDNCLNLITATVTLQGYCCPSFCWYIRFDKAFIIYIYIFFFTFSLKWHSWCRCQFLIVLPDVYTITPEMLMGLNLSFPQFLISDKTVCMCWYEATWSFNMFSWKKQWEEQNRASARPMDRAGGSFSQNLPIFSSKTVSQMVILMLILMSCVNIIGSLCGGQRKKKTSVRGQRWEEESG